MAFLSRELGIDLGTICTQIAEGGQVILEEPTVVAIAVDELKIVEVGQAAKEAEHPLLCTMEPAD